MKKEYILFIDSGIGGLSTLHETIKILPANYIYFADTCHSPYGHHTKNDIFQYLTKIIDFYMFKFNIKIVVLACNTATTCCVCDLRQKYTQLKFVGTEPAITLASKLGHKTILSITTPTTSQQVNYINLVSQTNVNIRTLSMPNLASDIESYIQSNNFYTKQKLLKSVFLILDNAKNCDCIVLGCTHYVFITKILQKFTSKTIINGNGGVAKQTQKIFDLLAIKYNTKPFIFFDCSASTKFAKQNYKKILRQILANLQKL